MPRKSPIIKADVEDGYKFWQSILKDYCQNNFTESMAKVAKFNNEPRHFFRFDNFIL